MPFRQLLRIIEGYPMQVPIKGGFAAWRPKVVIFTSDTHPNSWCLIKDTVSRTRALLAPHEQAQLWRRITRIYHLRKRQALSDALRPQLEAPLPPQEEIDATAFFANLDMNEINP